MNPTFAQGFAFILYMIIILGLPSQISEDYSHETFLGIIILLGFMIHSMSQWKDTD